MSPFILNSLNLSVDDLSGRAFVIGSSVLASVYLVLRFTLLPKRYPLAPPGPPGKPFFGNILQFPRDETWLGLAELGRKYGDIMQLKIFGRKYIVLNSYEAAADLLNKRSEMYAHRPPQAMAHLCGLGDGALLFQNYDDKLRDSRKMLSAEIGPRGIAHHHDLMQDEARLMVRRMLNVPGAASRLMDVAITSWKVLLMVGFGDKGGDGALAMHARVVGEYLLEATKHEKYIVDSFPILRYLPEWVPGCGFQRTARRSRESLDYLLNSPFNGAKKRMADGTSLPCFVSNSLENLETSERNEELVKWAAGSMFGAGLPTTRSSVLSFFLAMILYPEVQRKAQEELDRVLGPSMLPTFADRVRLPYIECVLKETLRWHPVVPLPVHSNLVDDEYKGFAIPAQSLVVANAWAYTHNPDVYQDPLVFNPDRFLPSQNPALGRAPETDPRQFVFGFGRRTCPGMHLADAFLFITISTVLSSFTIAPKLDTSGQPVLPKPTSGSRPPDFECVVEKRSDAFEKPA
ncbi:hypothetical protein M0805_006560 [Coniferiporia weirii]|nr:hypothetical protein M0805_006560 [Coniferiporia weirii]